MPFSSADRSFAQPGRSPVYAPNAMAATSHPLATQTAIQIMSEGGNAVDAAIAAVAVQCVVEPHMTGIGGDCFVILAEPDGTVHGLNGSGRSPAAANLDWYLENGFTDIPTTSAHSVTAPGAIKAWEELHQKFGRMDFKRLFADAISYAENGFPIAPRVASDWATLVDDLQKDDGAKLHCLRDGKAPAVGDIWKSPNLGATLRLIAEDGAAAFYQGEIAEEICSVVQAKGGFLSTQDLATVTADWVGTITTDYIGHTVHEIPPNGQGITTLILLRLMEKLGLPDDPAGLERAHLEMECARLAYLVRDHEVADPENMETTVERLLSDSYCSELAKQFDPAKRNEKLALPDPVGSDTIYLTIVDNDGLAVSFINSVFAGFGSKIVTPKSGIALQNRGSGFKVERGHPNAIGPSKRPMHTIIPAMVMKDNKVRFSFGVMGGQYQPMGQAHVLSNMLHYGMDPQRALDDPRIFWNPNGTLEAEAAVPNEIVDGMRSLGHKVERTGVHGGGQVISIEPGTGMLCGGSDPRKDGQASGY